MKKFLNLLVVGLALFSAYQFGVPFYHYLAFKSDLKELSRMNSNQFRQGEMMLKVQEMARDMNIPLKDKNIKLTRDSTYKIEVLWEETVNWLSIYQKTFQFAVDTSQKD
ncbi:MAG: hypothetical protein HZC48_12535 [Nitrospirae bacterium]|nr:hypothetical protein [Nitrospirota bacterium]